MHRTLTLLAACAATQAALAAPPAAAPGPQGSGTWLESQQLEAAASREHQEYEVVVARVKGAADIEAAGERVVVFRQGKPVWQSNAKEQGSPVRFTLHALGRDFDGSGQPQLHFSAFTGGVHCCTTHYIYRLKPQVRRHAVYPANNVGGTDFTDLPGRKTPIMISADDSTANVFAPYSNSYFPLVVLEVSPKGGFRFATDLMRTRLPGMAPPVCAQPAATANPWLRERCAEFTGALRKARGADIQDKLREIKRDRSAEKIKWDDYFATGVLSAVAAEMNRYAYTGYAAAGMNWLDGVWPGNDRVKGAFLQKLRESRVKSVFTEDLRILATDTR